MSRTLVVAVALAGGAACSGSSGGSDDLVYNVKIIANHQRITAYGCPQCPLPINPGGYLGWQEKRSLPRTYAVEVAGVRSNCPPLKPMPSGGAATGMNWNLTVSGTGKCVLVNQ